MRMHRQIALVGTLASLAVLAAVSHAAERVTLRSGSELVCDHLANVNAQVRLYLTSSDENYLDVAADDIVAVETIGQESVSPDAFPAAIDTPQADAQPVNVGALLNRAGAQHRLDPDLLASVVDAESDGQIHAISRTGARGLMQLMPGTAKDLGVRDSFSAEQNIAGGTTYLDALLMYYHENIALALAAYNAGPSAVDRYHGIPPYAETRRYVERVIHDFNRRKMREAKRQAFRAHWSSMAAMHQFPVGVR
ncbi:MAG: lytic transglycosylase domain-containing protein [Acidobacteriaceae bacterium]